MNLNIFKPFNPVKNMIALSLLFMAGHAFASNDSPKPITIPGSPTLNKLVDKTRWVTIKETEKGGIYFDPKTVEKTVFPFQALPAHGLPLEYKFWIMVSNLQEGKTLKAHLSTNCMTQNELEPESPEEFISRYFCESQDARNTINNILQARQTNQQSQARAAEQYKQTATNSIKREQGIQTLTGLTSIIPLYFMK